MMSIPNHVHNVSKLREITMDHFRVASTDDNDINWIDVLFTKKSKNIVGSTTFLENILNT